MKCQNIEQLKYEKSLYLVVGKDLFQREEALEVILSKLGNKKIASKTFDGAKFEIKELLQELDTYSFFSQKSAIVLRRLEMIAKNDLNSIEKYLEAPRSDICLIMEASDINRSTNIYKLSDKNGVVLDIPEEKPWEQERSILEWIQAKAAKLGCAINPDAAKLLAQHLGTEKSLLYRELEKLSLYIEEGTSIKTEDIQNVCSILNTQTIWQLGDALVKRDAPAAFKIAIGLVDDGVSFFQLVRQIRSQFQTKYQICSILNRGGGPADVATLFPYMKGRILDNNCQLARGYGMKRFARAMLAIDQTEAMGKSITSDERLLTERLIGQLIK